MKIIKASNANKNIIQAATSIGTTYYEVDIDDALDAIEKSDGNIWILSVLRSDGWDALDLDNNLFGSRVIDDKLYICQTDGQDIQVDEELVDPEKALDKYSIEELSAYIQPADDDTITKNITGYEISFSDVEKVAKELLEEGYSFNDIVRDAEDLSLISD